MVREMFYEPEKLVYEVEHFLEKLDAGHVPDYLTFVSNGEPTLDINLGREIQLLKKLEIPVAVITNSSLIYDKNVRDDLMKADWVSLKIDSTVVKVWKRFNRPVSFLNLNKILAGIKEFSLQYKGILNTETMLVEGFNDSEVIMQDNANFIASLNPYKAYLSIPIRPPAMRYIRPVRDEILIKIWQSYNKAGITAELLTGFEGTDTGYSGNAYEDIINITAVHPLREDTMANLLKNDKSSNSVVDTLVSQHLITEIKYEGNTYYVRNYHF